MPTLTRQVDRCQRLLADHLAAAIQVFGSGALGVIDLPPLTAPGHVAPAQLRAAATLYWCMCVEQAGMPGFVDALADGVWNGRLALPIGDAGTRIAEYRRDRDERRFNEDERRALYDHVFGAATQFPSQWQMLIEGLCDLGTMAADLGDGSVVSRINVAAQAIAQGLSDRAVGIVAFAAREIVAHVRAALSLLQDPELSRALGGGSVWQIVELHAAEVLGHALEPISAIDRAQTGLTILEWIAARTSAIEAGTLALRRGDPIVRAATTWRTAGAVS